MLFIHLRFEFSLFFDWMNYFLTSQKNHSYFVKNWSEFVLNVCFFVAMKQYLGFSVIRCIGKYYENKVLYLVINSFGRRWTKFLWIALDEKNYSSRIKTLFLVGQKTFWLLKKVGRKATFLNYLKTTWKGPLLIFNSIHFKSI